MNRRMNSHPPPFCVGCLVAFGITVLVVALIVAALQATTIAAAAIVSMIAVLVVIRGIQRLRR